MKVGYLGPVTPPGFEGTLKLSVARMLARSLESAFWTIWSSEAPYFGFHSGNRAAGNYHHEPRLSPRRASSRPRAIWRVMYAAEPPSPRSILGESWPDPTPWTSNVRRSR
jgi:hypothetical protein